jgi:putative redox protein
MTILLYVRRKRWPVRSLTFGCEHHREAVAQVEQINENSTAFVDVIDRTIRIDGDLIPEQFDRITYIAERCPIHQLLESKPLIRDNIFLQ